MMKLLGICANVLLCVNGFTIPYSPIQKQKPGVKFGRKSVIKNFSLGNQDIQSPAQLTKQIYDEVSKYGVVQNYNDFQSSLQNNQVEGVSLLTQNEQIKGIVSIDKMHNIGTYELYNFHVTKMIPSLVSGLLESLDKNHVKYDILYLPEPFDLGVIISNIFQFVALYFIGVILLQGIVPQFRNNNPMNMMTGGGGGDSYTEVESDEIPVNFTSVAGCDEAKYELVEVVDFLKQPEKYEKAGAKIPKGVLLEGPPGTGKTLLAQAVAGEANVNYLYASGSQFIETFVGVGASRVRNLFQRAKELSPWVIFLDEIDAIGRQRGAGLAGGNDEREQTLNEILTNMDGFIKNEGIIVIAATNRADILDNALTRPGRFDRKVVVPLPDMEGRRKIIDIHFKDKNIHDVYKSGYLDELARLTGGFSGADIANMVNEAAILSVRSNQTQITRTNLLDAFEKVTIGLPKLNKEPNIEVDRLVAVHEAGHTLLACLFNDIFTVRKVTINANTNGAGGYTLFTMKDKYLNYPTKKSILAQLMVTLGGRAAETVYFNKYSKNTTGLVNYNEKRIFREFDNLEVTTGASNDLRQATDLARNYVNLFGVDDDYCLFDNSPSQPFIGRELGMNSNKMSEITKARVDKEVERIINFALKETIKVVEENIDALSSISNKLIKYNNINSTVLKNIEISY